MRMRVHGNKMFTIDATADDSSKPLDALTDAQLLALTKDTRDLGRDLAGVMRRENAQLVLANRRNRKFYGGKDAA